MAQKNDPSTSPLSFEVDEQLYQKLRSLQKQLGGVHMSILVEKALREHPFSQVSKRRATRRQLSVRLPDRLRTELLKHSRTEKVSMALLLREALEELIATPVSEVKRTQAKEANMPPKKKTAAKKAVVRKASARKAGKRVAAKKAPVKKAAAKKTPSKAVKKITTKKVAVKKAAAKKTVSKKTVSKKAVAKKVAAKKAASKKTAVKKVAVKKAVAKKTMKKKSAAKRVAKRRK